MAYDPENEQQTDGTPPEPAAEPAAAPVEGGGVEAWPTEPGLERPTGVTVDATADLGADDDSDAPIALDEPPVEGRATEVRAEHVTLTQGGANTIDATTVSINQGGAGRVDAEELTISQGGVGLARAGSLTVREGGSAFAVSAESAQIDEGGNVFLLIAREISGQVRPVVDWRAALAFGVGFGAVLTLLRRRR